jgi:predicted NodU family carbamoyl transferase
VLIGVNLSHDYAHCVLDGGHLMLVEEERHSRQRYHWDDSSYTLACLDRYERAELSKVEAVFLNSPHVADVARRDGDLSSARRTYLYKGAYPGPEPEAAIAPGELLVEGLRIPAAWVSHYHAHAMSAYWASPFVDADVLCLDGGGDYGEGAVFKADEGEIVLVGRLIDVQLGSSYHHFSLRVFNAQNGFYESKVMAIAGYGRAELSDSGFLSRRGTLNAIDPAVRPSVHDVAEFQLRFEEGVLGLLDGIDRRAKALCLAGGCFYNVTLNTRIADSGLYRSVFVPPHAGDMGTAIGAALLAARAAGSPLPSREHAASPFLGHDLTVTRDELRELVVGLGDVPVLHGLDAAFGQPPCVG